MVSTVLHWSLFFTEKKDRRMNLTEIQSYSRHDCVAIHHVWPPQAKPGTQTEKLVEQTEIIVVSVNLF
jgi:hypothetical protein